jgi:hypothetical protein
MPAATNNKAKVAGQDADAAMAEVEAILKAEANRPTSAAESVALARIRKKLDDQLAALERK